jgi:hypothetical protein
MKLAPLALLFVWAAPSRADVSLPAPAQAGSWLDVCSTRIDATARSLELAGAARRGQTPYVHEDGTPNPVREVSYGVLVGPSHVELTVGEEAERRPDKTWRQSRPAAGVPYIEYFRRRNGRYARLSTDRGNWARAFKATLDECLEMGDPK